MRRCCRIKLTRAAFAADSAPLATSFALLLMQYMFLTYFTDSRLTQLQLIGYLARGQAAAKKGNNAKVGGVRDTTHDDKKIRGERKKCARCSVELLIEKNEFYF